MLDLGTVKPGTTIYIPFNTFSSDDPSASMTITGLATTDIEIYKNGSVTQRASDAGYALLDTDGIDFDGTTGIHGISIDLADNTTADFYNAGAQYWVVVASITLDAAIVNFVAATFRIGYPGAVLDTTIATLASQTSFTLTAGPAEIDALNGMSCVIHDIASAVQFGTAVISDYAATTKTVTLSAGTSFTAAAGDNISIMGLAPLQPSVGGRALVVSATGSVTTGVIADDAINYLTFSSDVGSQAYATNQIALAVRKALDEIKLDHLVAVADADDPVNDSIVAKLAASDGDWSGFSAATDSLEALEAVVAAILALLDDARAEPGDTAPPVNPDAMTKLDYVYKFLRNKIETTTTRIHVYDDAGTNKDHSSVISDDGTTFTRGEFAAGDA